MNKNKVIIEARINEYNMRGVNPNVPWKVEEIVEEAQRVREAGASILHFHARTDTGGAVNNPEIYGEIIRRIQFSDGSGKRQIFCSFPPWDLTATTRIQTASA